MKNQPNPSPSFSLPPPYKADFRRWDIKNGLCTLLFFVVTFFPAINHYVYIHNAQNIRWTGELDWNVPIKQAVTFFALIGVCTIFLSWREGHRWVQGLGRIVDKAACIPDKWLISIAFGIFFTLACVLSGVLFSHLPHSPDAASSYILSKMILNGHLYVPKHPLQEFFPPSFFFDNKGKYYSQFPPGHAMLLALGQLVGMPWIINPLLGALAAVTVYFLGCEIGNRSTGRIAAFLTIMSPFVVFMSSEYLNHGTALLALTLFVLFYIRMLKFQHWRDALLAGISIGYLGITRSQCAAAIGVFYVFHAGFLLFTRFRRYALLYIILAAGALPFFCFFLYYNWLSTGDTFITGYQKIWGSSMIASTWLTSWNNLNIWNVDIIRAAVQISVLNRELFCWPIASFILIFTLFLFHAGKKYSWILAATFFCLSFSLTMTMFIFTDFFGPKYLYEISGILIVLSALAIQRLPAIFRYYLGITLRRKIWRGTAILILCILCVIGFFGRTGELYKMYGNHYWTGNADYYYRVIDHTHTPALVFVGRKQFQYVDFTMPPDSNAPIIFALNLDDKNRLLMDYYPGRSVYISNNDFLQQIR